MYSVLSVYSAPLSSESKLYESGQLICFVHLCILTAIYTYLATALSILIYFALAC